MDEQESERTFFTSDGYITEQGREPILSSDEANVGYRAIQYFQEEAYLMFSAKFADAEITQALNDVVKDAGYEVAAYILGLDHEDYNHSLDVEVVYFGLMDEKQRQNAATKLRLVKLWLSANTMMLDTSSTDKKFVEKILTVPLPEFDNLSALSHLRHRPANLQTTEEMISALWGNYHEW